MKGTLTYTCTPEESPSQVCRSRRREASRDRSCRCHTLVSHLISELIEITKVSNGHEPSACPLQINRPCIVTPSAQRSSTHPLTPDPDSPAGNIAQESVLVRNQRRFVLLLHLRHVRHLQHSLVDGAALLRGAVRQGSLDRFGNGGHGCGMICLWVSDLI